MKSFVKTFCFIFLLLALNPFIGFSQITAQNDSTNIKLKNAAKEIMGEAGTCALITLDEKNLPMVRTMDPFPAEPDFTVWLGTNAKSRKVNQIKNNPNVTLYYVNSDHSGYVVIHGKALLVNDEKEKEKRWKTQWESFYPDKTKDFLLIKVSPQWMEVLSNSSGVASNPVTWQVPVVVF